MQNITISRRILAVSAVAVLSLGAAACSDDDGNEDDIDNPVDGVDDQIDDVGGEIEDEVDSETEGEPVAT
jgi:hypothetical protein